MLFPLAPQNTFLGTQTKGTLKLAAKFGTIAMAGSLLALSALGAARLDPAPLLPEPLPTNESSLLADGSSPTQQQATSRNRSGSAPAANASGPASLLSQTREAFYSVPFDRSVYVLRGNQDKKCNAEKPTKWLRLGECREASWEYQASGVVHGMVVSWRADEASRRDRRDTMTITVDGVEQGNVMTNDEGGSQQIDFTATNPTIVVSAKSSNTIYHHHMAITSILLLAPTPPPPYIASPPSPPTCTDGEPKAGCPSCTELQVLTMTQTCAPVDGLQDAADVRVHCESYKMTKDGDEMPCRYSRGNDACLADFNCTIFCCPPPPPPAQPSPPPPPALAPPVPSFPPYARRPLEKKDFVASPPNCDADNYAFLRLGECTAASWEHTASGTVVGIEVEWRADENDRRHQDDSMIITVDGKQVGRAMRNDQGGSQQIALDGRDGVDGTVGAGVYNPTIVVSATSKTQTYHLHMACTSMTLLVADTPTNATSSDAPPPDTDKGCYQDLNTRIRAKSRAGSDECRCGWWCSPQPKCPGATENVVDDEGTCKGQGQCGEGTPHPASKGPQCACGPGGCECGKDGPPEIMIKMGKCGPDNKPHSEAAVYRRCYDECRDNGWAYAGFATNGTDVPVEFECYSMAPDAWMQGRAADCLQRGSWKVGNHGWMVSVYATTPQAATRPGQALGKPGDALEPKTMGDARPSATIAGLEGEQQHSGNRTRRVLRSGARTR